MSITVFGQNKNSTIKLDFFKEWNFSVGDAMGKYTVSNIPLKSEQYIFITGCSDPGKGIYNAAIKVNGKFILLNVSPNSKKNKNTWPQNFYGGGFKVNVLLADDMNSGSLEVIQGTNKAIYQIHGEYKDEWGEGD
jgi:hypothetical protein